MIKLKPNRKWTDADRAQLISLLEAGMPVAKVASKLKRTESAVRVQATLIRVSYSADLALRYNRNERLRPARGATVYEGGATSEM